MAQKQRPQQSEAKKGRQQHGDPSQSPVRRRSQPSQSTGTGGGGSGGPVRERNRLEKDSRGGIPAEAAHTATGSSGVGSGLQSGGTRPAGGRMGGFGSIGTGGASTGPGRGTAGATKPPKSK